MSGPVSATGLEATPVLPDAPRGRSAIWSGVALLVVIEAAAVSALAVGYFYLRVRAQFWPPPGVDAPDLGTPALRQALVLALVVPLALAERASRRGRSGRLRLLLPVAILLNAVYAALGFHEYGGLAYGWDSHAYGSAYWTLTGYTLLHALALLVMSTALWAVLLVGALGRKELAAVESVALYGYFVAASSAFVFLVVYLSPYLV